MSAVYLRCLVREAAGPEPTDSTWHGWQAQYGGMTADDAKRLKSLERQN